MKKDFVQLIKEMRLAFKPEFEEILASDTTNIEKTSQSLSDLEKKQDQMIADAGYEQSEFDNILKEYFMDFSSNNPDEWIIRHDPENAQIITGDSLSIT